MRLVAERFFEFHIKTIAREVHNFTLLSVCVHIHPTKTIGFAWIGFRLISSGELEDMSSPIPGEFWFYWKFMFKQIEQNSDLRVEPTHFFNDVCLNHYKSDQISLDAESIRIILIAQHFAENIKVTKIWFKKTAHFCSTSAAKSSPRGKTLTIRVQLDKNENLFADGWIFFIDLQKKLYHPMNAVISSIFSHDYRCGKLADEWRRL